MKDLDLSIAMCTHNGSRFLIEQLESITSQRRLPDELIICDDCSSDATPEILQRFRQRASFPVRVELSQKNLGSTKNFEKAIELCRGEVIALADQDDIWHPEKLSRVMEAFHRDQSVGAVFSDAELIDAEAEPLGKTLWESVFFTSRQQAKFAGGKGLKIMLKHPRVTGATMAFRSKFRGLVMPIPSIHIHDHWIALLIASVSQLAPIRNALIQYRKHEAQQIGPGYVDSLWQQVEVSKRKDRDYLSEAERFSEVCERLCDRCATFRPHPYALGLIQQKIRHQKARGSFPSSKFSRLSPIAREIASLRYWRYSNGLGSVAKDLLV